MYASITLTIRSQVNQLADGVAFSQLFDLCHPGKIKLEKLNMQGTFTHEREANLKILNKGLSKMGVPFDVPVSNLAKGKFQDNYNFLKLVKDYVEESKPDLSAQDPLQRRIRMGLKRLNIEAKEHQHTLLIKPSLPYQSSYAEQHKLKNDRKQAMAGPATNDIDNYHRQPQHNYHKHQYQHHQQYHQYPQHQQRLQHQHQQQQEAYLTQDLRYTREPLSRSYSHADIRVTQTEADTMRTFPQTPHANMYPRSASHLTSPSRSLLAPSDSRAFSPPLHSNINRSNSDHNSDKDNDESFISSYEKEYNGNRSKINNSSHNSDRAYLSKSANYPTGFHNAATAFDAHHRAHDEDDYDAQGASHSKNRYGGIHNSNSNSKSQDAPIINKDDNYDVSGDYEEEQRIPSRSKSHHSHSLAHSSSPPTSSMESRTQSPMNSQSPTPNRSKSSPPSQYAQKHAHRDSFQGEDDNSDTEYDSWQHQSRYSPRRNGEEVADPADEGSDHEGSGGGDNVHVQSHSPTYSRQYDLEKRRKIEEEDKVGPTHIQSPSPHTKRDRKDRNFKSKHKSKSQSQSKAPRKEREKRSTHKDGTSYANNYKKQYIEQQQQQYEELQQEYERYQQKHKIQQQQKQQQRQEYQRQQQEQKRHHQQLQHQRQKQEAQTLFDKKIEDMIEAYEMDLWQRLEAQRTQMDSIKGLIKTRNTMLYRLRAIEDKCIAQPTKGPSTNRKILTILHEASPIFTKVPPALVTPPTQAVYESAAAPSSSSPLPSPLFPKSHHTEPKQRSSPPSPQSESRAAPAEPRSTSAAYSSLSPSSSSHYPYSSPSSPIVSSPSSPLSPTRRHNGSIHSPPMSYSDDEAMDINSRPAVDVSTMYHDNHDDVSFDVQINTNDESNIAANDTVDSDIDDSTNNFDVSSGLYDRANDAKLDRCVPSDRYDNDNYDFRSYQSGRKSMKECSGDRKTKMRSKSDHGSNDDTDISLGIDDSININSSADIDIESYTASRTRTNLHEIDDSVNYSDDAILMTDRDYKANGSDVSAGHDYTNPDTLNVQYTERNGSIHLAQHELKHVAEQEGKLPSLDSLAEEKKKRLALKLQLEDHERLEDLAFRKMNEGGVAASGTGSRNSRKSNSDEENVKDYGPQLLYSPEHKSTIVRL